jgi:hypothetical protein
MNINFVGLIASFVLGFVGLHYNLPVVYVPAAVVYLVCFVRQLNAENKSSAAGRALVKETDAQLRQDLVAVQKLALAKLAGADAETQSKVVELLVEAGKHLGDPYTNSRLVYTSDYFVNWNREGLALVAQARKLIDDYVAAGQPKA